MLDNTHVFILFISLFLFLLFGIGIGYLIWGRMDYSMLSPLGLGKRTRNAEIEKYSFENLRKNTFKPSKIVLQKVLREESQFTSHLFTYLFESKQVSGMINIPEEKGKLPVVIMIRGYIDKEIYETGIGTVRAAEVFAKNGFITLAPDFLGFGESDDESENSLENRFSRPAQILQLITSVKSLPQADTNNIFIWAHSNGGQVALSILEITRKEIPTTLWAPVSKSFPYSVLYYSDEFSDKGRYLRRIIYEFEKYFNVDEYSIDTYLQNIQAPLIIHQGGADDAVPSQWSDELVERLEGLGKDVIYYFYPGADHNMLGSWNTVVQRDVAFFQKHLQRK